MANKIFPTDTPYKATPADNDGLLISDSASTSPSHQPKMTLVSDLVYKVTSALSLTSYATNANVLNLNQTDSYIPTADYHPTTKTYVDTVSGNLITYADNIMATHIVDLHALSGTHIADTAALSGAISTHTADVSNPHQVTATQVGLGTVSTDIVSLSAAIDVNTSSITSNDSDIGFLSGSIDSLGGSATIVALSGAIDTNTASIVSLSADVDLLEIGSKVYTATASGSWTPDITNYNHFDITVNENITVANPTHSVGFNGMLVLQQDGSGGHTIDFASNWIFPSGAPVENTSANAFNVFRYTVLSANNILVEFVTDYVEV